MNSLDPFQSVLSVSFYFVVLYKATERIAELEDLKREKQSKNHMFESFIRNLESCQDTIDEFDERLWRLAIDKVIVMQDGRFSFQFRMARKL
jgi:hypothetical protein